MALRSAWEQVARLPGQTEPLRIGPMHAVPEDAAVALCGKRVGHRSSEEFPGGPGTKCQECRRLADSG